MTYGSKKTARSMTLLKMSFSCGLKNNMPMNISSITLMKKRYFEERNRQMQIRVDYEQVHQSASMIKQKAAQYDETIQKIYSRMYQMQSVWQGSDNQAFIDKLEQFKPQLNRMTEIIEQYALYLQKSADNYQALLQDRIMKAKNLA